MLALAPSSKDTPRVLPIPVQVQDPPRALDPPSLGSDHGAAPRKTRRASLNGGSAPTRRQSSTSRKSTTKQCPSTRRLLGDKDKPPSSRRLLLEEQPNSDHNQQQRQSRKLKKKPSSRTLQHRSLHLSSTRNLMVDASAKTTNTTKTAPAAGNGSNYNNNTVVRSSKKKMRKSKSEVGTKSKQHSSSEAGLRRNKTMDQKIGHSQSEHLPKKSTSDHAPKKHSSTKKATRASIAKKAAARPMLVRSNSLDSKLSDMGSPKPEQTTTIKGKSTSKKKAPVAKRGRTKSTVGPKKRSNSNRPVLQRSNSLDSKLSNLDNQNPAEQEEPNTAAPTGQMHIEIVTDSAKRPTLMEKQASARHLEKQASQRQLALENQTSSRRLEKQTSRRQLEKQMSSRRHMDASRQGSSSKHLDGSVKNHKRKSSSKDPKSKSAGKTQSTSARPTLVRSNSLDSMLSNREDTPKAPPQTLEQLDTRKQRPSLSKKKGSSRRHMKSMEAKSDHAVIGALPGRIAKDQPPQRPTLVRSNSLDSKLSHMSNSPRPAATAAAPATTTNNKPKPAVDTNTNNTKQNHKPNMKKAPSLRRVKTLECKSDHAMKKQRKSIKANHQKTDPPRPDLVRSNSLDSKLSNMSNLVEGEQQQQQQQEAKAEPVVHQTAKKKGSLRRLMSLDAKVDHPHPNKATAASGHHERSPLVRSNSLDSKLDSLAGDDEQRQDNNEGKQEEELQVQNPRPNLARKMPSRRSLASASRGSSRRSLVGEDTGLGPTSDHSSSLASRRGRARSRRSLLSEHLAVAGKNGDPLDPRAIAAHGYFGAGRGQSVEARGGRRSSSVDSRAPDAAMNAGVPTRDPSVSRRGMRRVSSLAANDTNHAMKMFMERTAKEEAAVLEQKNAKKEKISNLQKTFQSLAKEQSKFTDTLLAKMSSLSRVPAVNPTGDGLVGTSAHRTIKRASIAGPPTTTTSGNATAAAAAGGRPVGALMRSTSISDMAKRMKDLGSNFRMTKKQTEDQEAELNKQRKASTERLKGEIPLLMTVATMAVR